LPALSATVIMGRWERTRRGFAGVGFIASGNRSVANGSRSNVVEFADYSRDKFFQPEQKK